MRKMIALLLCLLLLLSAGSLGEAERRAVEFEDFTIAVGEQDLLQLGEEIGSSSIFRLFPAYDAAAVSHPNIIATWVPSPLDGLTNEQVLAFGNGVMQAAAQNLTANNIVVINEEMLRSDRNEADGAITVLFTLEVDAATLGVDAKMNVYMDSRYVPMGEKGCYSFTVGCESVEEAEMLFDYLDRHLTIKK